MPDISVIIPTHRREHQLVESIRSALDQERVSVEVIVLDDSLEGSARTTVAAIDDRRVRYVHGGTPSNGKPAKVRNQGILLARGKYLHFLDDDDHLLAGSLHALSRALDQNPRAAVAFGRVRPFGRSPEIVQRYHAWFEWAAKTAKIISPFSWLTTGVIMFRGTLIINSVCMMRRTCAISLGGYDSRIPVYEDVEFHMRGIRKWGHVFVDHPVLHYRTGEPSLIHDLKGNNQPIVSSYEIMHRKYREVYGPADYLTLKMISKLLPVGDPYYS